MKRAVSNPVPDHVGLLQLDLSLTPADTSLAVPPTLRAAEPLKFLRRGRFGGPEPAGGTGKSSINGKRLHMSTLLLKKAHRNRWFTY